MPFDVLYGQEKAVSQLEADLSTGRIAQAYLFCGPEGVGKKQAALEFAMALNCAQGQGRACGECSSCARIRKGMHPDVHVCDPQGEDITIEQVRQLQRDASMRPYEGGMKVHVLLEAHLMNPASSHALLKTLEEPAKGSVIILVTAKPQVLLKTVVSRCRVIRFRALPADSLAEILRDSFGIKEHAAHFLAYYCEGSIGRCLEFKDTDLLAQKNKSLDAWLGRAAAASFSDKQQLRDSLNILAGWLRDICLYNCGVPAQGLMHSDRQDLLDRYSRFFPVSKAANALKAVAEALYYLDHNVNTKLIVATIQGYLPRGA